MKLILASLIASAAAFAPSKVAQTSTSLKAFEDAIGAQEPLGFWDPLGMLDGADQERFDRLRYVELKHGRIAMLAVAGHIHTTMGYHFPGLDGIPTGWAGTTQVPMTVALQTLATVAVLELFIMKDVKGTGETPGDFRNGFDFGWDKFTPEEKRQKLSIELNNGRAAQMGILGLMVHEQINGNPYVINELLGYHVSV
jgi:hypothetical protein